MDVMFASLQTDGMQLLSIHVSYNSFSGLQRTEDSYLINHGRRSSGPQDIQPLQFIIDQFLVYFYC